MINAKTGQPGQVGGADRLHRPARDAEGAEGLSASTVKGAEPDQKTLPLSYEWSQGPGKQPVLHHPGPGVPEEAGRPVLRIQSDVLQGKITPEEAAKKMQDVVSAWAKG